MYGLFDLLIKIFMAAFGIRLIMPDLSPMHYHPVYRVLIAMTEPVLHPLRRLIPVSRQGFDRAALVALALLVILRGVIRSLEMGLPPNLGVIQSVVSAMDFTFTLLAILFLGVFFISIDSPFGYSQLGRLIITLTEPLLSPLRRVFGRNHRGWDPVPLVGIALLAVIQGAVVYQISHGMLGFGEGGSTFLPLIWMSLRGLLDTIMAMLFWVILIRAVISWFNPDPSSPLFQVIILYSDPVLSPIQRIMPFTYGIDFSPLIAVMIIGFIRDRLL